MAETVMHFFSFGINHHAAPVKQRDAFVLDEATIRALYRTIECSAGAEYVLVSTCNRTECYLHGSEEDVGRVRAALSACAGEAWPEDASFEMCDEEAVSHVLEVTAGLDSMVLGDGQILGQVKEAYRLAVEEGRVTAVLHRLMHTAFATAKRVMNETNLTSGHASVAGTAVSIAMQALAGRLNAGETPSVLIVGAGHMGRLVVEALEKEKRLALAITNRSCERIDELVAHHPRLTSVAWSRRREAVQNADAVFVASSADEYVLRREEFEASTIPSEEKLMIDLAVPRNVDPAIDSLPGYRVYDLDALQHMIEDVIDIRKTDLSPARHICDEMLADFVSWFFHHQALQPAIRAILETFDSIRLQEIERHQGRFNEADYRQLDRITKSIMQKVLSVPVVRLKNVGPDNIDYVHGIKLLQLLFARGSCEDPVADFGDFSESMLEFLAQPERADLSALASCPFDEGKTPMRHEGCPVPASQTRNHRYLKLGTRKSALAMWQAEHVKQRVEAADCVVTLTKITTKGDQILDKPLSEIEGKSLFTRELDLAILDGRVDFAVHSLKDLPTELPEGLILAAISRRENPFDAFVAHPSLDGSLADLPIGARIGTSSLRRTAQLKAWRPDLEIVPIRGNVDTRLTKLDESDMHGIVLAAAGLIRLGLEARIHTLFDTDTMVPAVGQGALGIVCAASNIAVHHILRAVLHDARTASCVMSERAFLRCLEGSCRVPVGAFADWNEEGQLILEGFVASVDGTQVLRDRERVDSNNPTEAGMLLAHRLLNRGAEALLEEARSLG